MEHKEEWWEEEFRENFMLSLSGMWFKDESGEDYELSSEICHFIRKVATKAREEGKNTYYTKGFEDCLLTINRKKGEARLDGFNQGLLYPFHEGNVVNQLKNEGKKEACEYFLRHACLMRDKYACPRVVVNIDIINEYKDSLGI